jgi:protein SCO1/2
LTPKGKVARYFYGIDYPVRDVQFGLMEAAEERIGSLADVLLLLCYHYDPATGTYGSIVFGSLRIAGVATVAGLVALVALLVRADRKRQRIRANSLAGAPVGVIARGPANPTT